MSDQEITDGDTQDTITDGAIKGGVEGYFFNPTEAEGIDAGTGYSSAHGAIIEGERHQGGLVDMDANDGDDPHKHPNEQFIYLVQGTVEARIENEEAILSEGSIIYVPPDAVHEIHPVGDQNVKFFTTKDLRHGIVGEAVEE